MRKRKDLLIHRDVSVKKMRDYRTPCKDRACIEEGGPRLGHRPPEDQQVCNLSGWKGWLCSVCEGAPGQQFTRVPATERTSVVRKHVGVRVRAHVYVLVEEAHSLGCCTRYQHMMEHGVLRSARASHLSCHHL